ncbi:unnamed protein product [Prorocentrum cordatum]|uniref:Uncharacterized protein n=1 Tax=Prorocentrum cordatum TaxID=2364126 RepID=A0ABN9W1C2_9DINO|nr:unnamed protein product [Polarella glacialis]
MEAHCRVARRIADGSGMHGPIDIFQLCFSMLVVLWFGTRRAVPQWRLLEKRWQDADVALRLFALTESIKRPLLRAKARKCIGARLRALGLPGLTPYRMRVPAQLVCQVRRTIKAIIQSTRSLSTTRRWWWLRQTAIVKEPVRKWSSLINAPAASREADVEGALSWSDETWSRRMQARRCKLVAVNWEVTFWEEPESYGGRTANIVSQWVRQNHFSVPRLLATQGRWFLDFFHCRGTASLEQKRDSDRRAYRKYTQPMRSIPDGHVVTRDDKQKRWCWHMPEPHYIATLIVYIVTSPHWHLTSRQPAEVSLLIAGILKAFVPARLHARFRLHDEVQWLPYLYTTLKSKCYGSVGEGRFCEKEGHSCARKIVSYVKWPARQSWRGVSRALSHILKRHGGSWESWSLTASAAEVRAARAGLAARPRGEACRCQRCRASKPEFVGVVADAGQFFEVVQAREAVRCVARLLRRVEAQTGLTSVTIGQHKGESTYLGGSPYSCTGKQWWLTFEELILIFSAAMEMKWCSVGARVAEMTGTPIGGLCSKIAASAVLGEAERAWQEDPARRQRAHFHVPGLAWEQAAARRRYVDDLLTVSNHYCEMCLREAIASIYPIEFDVAESGPTVTWLDMRLDVASGELTWNYRRPILPPPFAASGDWFRGCVLGRTKRCQEIGLSMEATCSAIALLLSDLRCCGLKHREFRHLYYSTAGCFQHFHLRAFRAGLRACGF